MAPGGYETPQWDFNFPDIGSGSYSVWIIAVVDVDNEVVESDENNTWKANGSFTAEDPSGVLYLGPASGSIASGGLANTAEFANSVESIPKEQLVNRNIAPIGRLNLLPDPRNLLEPLGPAGSNEIDDVLSGKKPHSVDLAPDKMIDFIGLTETNMIPPDPIIAAGPDHLLVGVNSDFGIFDKSGTLQKQINATSWFSNVLSGIGTGNISNAFDPKVIYDHFSNRFIMVWLAYDDVANSAWFLISTSDDSDPNGVWYNFAVPSDVNGSSYAGNWADYEGLGVDNQAIYITSNQFSFSNTFEYVKVRIFDKMQFYNNTAGVINWTDLWDLRDPDNLNVNVFTVRPALTFGSPNAEYLLSDSRYLTGTFMTLWTLINPLSTPTMTAINIATTSSISPPNANQLGGGIPLIDVGGRRIRNVVYRNGSVWTAHSVADVSGQFARARYVRINVSGPTVQEDFSFGADNYWYSYPAVTVDAASNLYMVFNRSGDTEFAGIRYTGKLTTEPTLQPSSELKAGETNYVKTYGGTRNRWGDYSGIAVDPQNTSKVWMFAEYAASPSNTWGTWIGQVSFTVAQEVVIDVGSGSGASGSEVLIPFTVANFDGISSFQFSMHLDPSIAQFVSVEEFGLPGLASGNFGTNQVGNGILTVSWDDPDGTCKILNDGDHIFKIRFQLIGIPGQTSTVYIDGDPTTVEIVDCNLQVISLATNPGEIRILNTVSITGTTVNYDDNNIPLADVMFSLTGDDNQQTVSEVDGSYSFTVDAGGNYTVTPFKEGDDPAANGVTTLDIALIRRHILGIDPLPSPYSIIGADANCSEAVTTLDITWIRRLILAIIPSYDCDFWKYVNSDYVFPDPQNPFPYEDSRTYFNLINIEADQDFVGIKLGDVNGSWNPSRTGLSKWADEEFNVDEPTVKFDVENQIASEDAEIIVPFIVSDFKEIGGFQFTLEWDPSILQFVSVGDYNLKGISEGNFGITGTSEGILTVAWDDINGGYQTVADGTSVFAIWFRVLGYDGSSSAVNFTSTVTQMFSHNGVSFTALNIAGHGGVITIKNIPTEFSVGNYPNPFNPSTTISYTLPENVHVKLDIYNLLGQLIDTLVDEYQEAGIYNSVLDGGELSSGVYFYRIIAGEKTKSAKILLLK